MSNFSRKNLFKEIGRTCLFDSAKDGRAHFVLLWIFYFGKGLRSIKFVRERYHHAIFPSLILPPKNYLEGLSFLFIFLHVKSFRSLFLEVAISLAHLLEEESLRFRRSMRRRNHCPYVRRPVPYCFWSGISVCCNDKKGSIMVGVAMWEILTLNMKYARDCLL